ncbi:MAG: glutathione S-transferase family protein [Parvularculaceae bacterium]
MKFYTNWFSPFARKVALALDYKGLERDTVDGLAHAHAAELKALNPRAEVPALVDDGLVVVNSSDILAYLDHRYPDRPPIYPADPALRVRARAVERLADARIDAILLDCSIWTWAKRDDAPPEGMFEAAQRDLDDAFAQIEKSFAAGGGDYMFGAAPGVAEFALWPHLSALRPLGFTLDADQFPKTHALLARLRSETAFRQDAARTGAFLKSVSAESHETTKIFWRGDRIEWLLARGFHKWFFKEIEEDRVLWPI